MVFPVKENIEDILKAKSRVNVTQPNFGDGKILSETFPQLGQCFGIFTWSTKKKRLNGVWVEKKETVLKKLRSFYIPWYYSYIIITHSH